MNKIDWRRFFVVNLFLILLGLIMLLFSVDGDIKNTDWKTFVQNISFVFITIGAVDLLYKIFAKNEELSIIKKTTKEFSTVIEEKVKSLQGFNDVGLIGIDEELSFTKSIQNSQNELLFINTFIPDLKQISHLLKERIREGKIERINVYILDNRNNSKGAELLDYRAATFGENTNLRLYVKDNVEVLCGIAQTLDKSATNLKEFKLHFYNISPSFSLWQFNKSVANISFFLYDLRAISTTQFTIDFNAKSKLVFEIRNHIDYLAKSVIAHEEKEKCSFDLLNEKDVGELLVSQNEKQLEKNAT